MNVKRTSIVNLDGNLILHCNYYHIIYLEHLILTAVKYILELTAGLWGSPGWRGG